MASTVIPFSLMAKARARRLRASSFIRTIAWFTLSMVRELLTVAAWGVKPPTP